jgi:hypothetical protein
MVEAVGEDTQARWQQLKIIKESGLISEQPPVSVNRDTVVGGVGGEDSPRTFKAITRKEKKGKYKQQ